MSESVFALVAETWDKSKYTLTEVTDRNGKTVKRWLRKAGENESAPALRHENTIRTLIKEKGHNDGFFYLLQKVGTEDRRRLEAKYGTGGSPDALIQAMAPKISDTVSGNPKAGAALKAAQDAIERHASAPLKDRKAAVRAAVVAALKPPTPQKIAGSFDLAEHGATARTYPRGFRVIPPQQVERARAAYAPATAFIESVTGGIDGAQVAFGTDSGGRGWASKKGGMGHKPGPEGAEYVAVIGQVPADPQGVEEQTELAVHELGHVIEYHKPRAIELAQQFLKHRCGDEPATVLAEAFPHAGYDADEKGRKDNFQKVFGEAAYYVGKDYGGGGTEVVAMGLEYLYKDPAKFVKADPEYAQFLFHILTM